MKQIYEVEFQNQENKPVTMYLRLSDTVAALCNSIKRKISEPEYLKIMEAKQAKRKKLNSKKK